MSSRLSLVVCRYKQHGSIFKSNIIGELLSSSCTWLEPDWHLLQCSCLSLFDL